MAGEGGATRSSALQKASQPSPQVREALEAILGRPLRAEESISVRAYEPKSAPEGPPRRQAYQKLFQRIHRTADRAKSAPDAEIDAAIDEAADFVRHSPE